MRIISACQHRGESLRTVTCRPCQGMREAVVHACAVHGECTERAGVRSRGMSGRLIHACRFCEEFEAREAEEG